MRSQARTHRFYVGDLAGDRMALSAAQSHHAARVLRLRVGAAVELFDGRGGAAVGTICRLDRSQVVVAVAERRGPAERGGPEVHLAFAAPKGKRLDWLLEKATELGAASLRPVIFERSVSDGEDLHAAKRNRWHRHCIAAAAQCGLDFLPEIGEPARLGAFLDDARATAPDAVCLVGHARHEAQPIAAALADRPPGRPVWLLVGPEGGLTDQEMVATRRAGFLPVRLGRTTLRVETAAIALLAAAIAARDA